MNHHPTDGNGIKRRYSSNEKRRNTVSEDSNFMWLVIEKRMKIERRVQCTVPCTVLYTKVSYCNCTVQCSAHYIGCKLNCTVMYIVYIRLYNVHSLVSHTQVHS